jgi:hypothetical protein
MSSPSLASQLSPLCLSAKDLLLTTKAINADVALLQQQSGKSSELFSPLSRAYLSGVKGSKAKPSGLGCVTKSTEAEVGGFASESKIYAAPQSSGEKAVPVSLTQSSLRGTGGKVRAVKRHLLSSSSSAHLLAGLILDAIHASKASSSLPSSVNQQQSTPFGPTESFKASYTGPLGSIREQLAAEIQERGLDATYRVAAAKFLQRRLAQEREWGSTSSSSSSHSQNQNRFPGTRKTASGELAAEMQAALEKLTQQREASMPITTNKLIDNVSSHVDPESDDKIATFNESDELDDALLDDALDDLLG